MKKSITLIMIVLLSLPLFAQQKETNRSERNSNNIENFIDDLSATQKTRIDIITRKSKATVDTYRKQLQSVRDSIRTLMDSQEDNSSVLFPLFEREGELQTAISKEYYRAKTSIDAVLTPEQYQTLRNNMKEPAPREFRHGDGPNPRHDNRNHPHGGNNKSGNKPNR